eukprot:7379831-Prymnesium_polylepis.2
MDAHLWEWSTHDRAGTSREVVLTWRRDVHKAGAPTANCNRKWLRRRVGGLRPTGSTAVNTAR